MTQLMLHVDDAIRVLLFSTNPYCVDFALQKVKDSWMIESKDHLDPTKVTYVLAKSMKLCSTIPLYSIDINRKKIK